MVEFKEGDEVILTKFASDLDVMLWRDTYSSYLGLKARVLQVHSFNDKTYLTVEVDSPPLGRSSRICWLPSGLILASESIPPTVRSKSNEKPQWLIAREVGLEPGCCVCGVPRNVCSYHR